MAKQKDTSKYIPRKTENSDWVNFIAMVAGMVTTVLIGLSAWNYFVTPPSVQKVLDSADGDEESGMPKLTNISTRDFDRVLEMGTAEQLEELLAQLNNWDRKAPLSVRVSDNTRRVQVASQMLTFPLSPSQRVLASESKISGLSALYGLGVVNNLKTPGVGADLLAAAKKHATDPNAELAQTAKLAIARVEIYEFIKQPEQNKGAPFVVEQLLVLLRDYPDDERVLGNVKLIVASLGGLERGLHLQILRELKRHASEFHSPSVTHFFHQIGELVLLTESGLLTLQSDRWVNGKSGQRELLKTAVALAGDATGRESVLIRLRETANWFEQVDEWDSARQIYQATLDSVPSRSSPEVSKMAKQFADGGLRRCELVGQEIVWNGLLTRGGEWSVDEMKNQVAVVLFWSASNQKSVAALRSLDSKARRWKRKDVVLVAVCVDAKRTSMHIKVAGVYKGLVFVDYDGGAFEGESLPTQCPASQLPHTLVVDHLGVVVSANIPLDELNTKVEFLVIQQSEGQ